MATLTSRRESNSPITVAAVLDESGAANSLTGFFSWYVKNSPTLRSASALTLRENEWG
jgi:hypothetical protein